MLLDTYVIRPHKHAEVYAACNEHAHSSCPAGRPNIIPLDGPCSCSCHHPRPPV